MKNVHWLILAILMLSFGFAGGYAVSAHTGTEPGYFGAVEAAGLKAFQMKCKTITRISGNKHAENSPCS
jgi:hypothetical protein